MNNMPEKRMENPFVNPGDILVRLPPHGMFLRFSARGGRIMGKSQIEAREPAFVISVEPYGWDELRDRPTWAYYVMALSGCAGYITARCNNDMTGNFKRIAL